MNERDKVLLQREAVWKWISCSEASERVATSVEPEIRRLFPFPSEKVPNVQPGKDGKRWRQNPATGRVEVRHPGNEHWDEPIWPEDETAIRAVIAEPYRLVSGEDGE